MKTELNAIPVLTLSACLVALGLPLASAEDTCVVETEAVDRQFDDGRLRVDPAFACFEADPSQARVIIRVHAGIHGEAFGIYGWAQGYLILSLSAAEGVRTNDPILRGDVCPAPGAACTEFELP